MRDNSSAFSVLEYDRKIKMTVPYYEEFHNNVISVINSYFDYAVAWLDVGCGTGKMAEQALQNTEIERFVCCDNSSNMLNAAETRLDNAKAEFILSDVQNLNYKNEFDVVTAVQVFHYLSAEERRNAVQKCFGALRENGILITFENFAPDTEAGKRLYLKRWKQYQVQQGKTEEECENHILRYGKDYFPISVEEHKRLIKECGFKTVELLWCSYMQAGLIGIK